MPTTPETITSVTKTTSQESITSVTGSAPLAENFPYTSLSGFMVSGSAPEALRNVVGPTKGQGQAIAGFNQYQVNAPSNSQGLPQSTSKENITSVSV